MPCASRSHDVAKRSSPSSCTSLPSRSRGEAPGLPVVLAQRILDRDQRIAARPGCDLAGQCRPVQQPVLARQPVAAAVDQLRRGDIQRERGIDAGALDPAGRDLERLLVARPAAPRDRPRRPPGRCRGRARGAPLPHRRAPAPRPRWPRANVVAASGITSTSCTSTARPACAPPESTLTIGRGSSGAAPGESSSQSGVRVASAAASAQATEAARTAFAPSRPSVGLAVELAQAGVDGGLVGGVAAPQRGSDLTVDRGHGGERSSPAVAIAAVAPLMRLVAAGRRPRGHRRAALRAACERHVAGHGRRPARVQRLEGQHALDGTAAHASEATSGARAGAAGSSSRRSPISRARRTPAGSRNVAGERPSVRASSMAPV